MWVQIPPPVLDRTRQEPPNPRKLRGETFITIGSFPSVITSGYDRFRLDPSPNCYTKMLHRIA